jgi:hypothetical protein
MRSQEMRVLAPRMFMIKPIGQWSRSTPRCAALPHHNLHTRSSGRGSGTSTGSAPLTRCASVARSPRVRPSNLTLQPRRSRPSILPRWVRGNGERHAACSGLPGLLRSPRREVRTGGLAQASAGSQLFHVDGHVDSFALGFVFDPLQFVPHFSQAIGERRETICHR